MKKTNRKQILGVVILVVVLAAMALLYYFYGPGTTEGEKAITIMVIGKEQQEQEYELHTDATVLREAMEEAQGLTFSGEEAEYGLMVDTINGVRADYELDGAYWNFLVNDEYCKYGIDTQPVNDGDVFTIKYTLADE